MGITGSMATEAAVFPAREVLTGSFYAVAAPRWQQTEGSSSLYSWHLMTLKQLV